MGHSNDNERFAKLYFAHFLGPVPSAIFHSETEAVAWMGTLHR